MSNITFDMPIDRTVTVITDGRNITNIVFDMNIPDRPDPICEKAKEQFLAYFDGRLKEFSLPYDISGIGTPFFRSILTAVQKIPYGERVTYMQTAEMAGSKAVRACGSALKRNPLPILIPCHRIVPASGEILKTTTMTFEQGDTVFDVLCAVRDKYKLHMEYSGAKGNEYIEGINNLYEFDGGRWSGWMYCVNDWYPNYGCGQYVVKSGDVIEWNYTCDLGKDLGQTWLAG